MQFDVDVLESETEDHDNKLAEDDNSNNENLIVVNPTTIIQNSKLKFGVVDNDYSNKNGSIDSLENILRSEIDILSLFKQYGNEFNKNIVEEDLDYAVKGKKTILIAWEPWDPDKGLIQSRDYLTDIIQGRMDNYLLEFVTKTNSLDTEVIIRFGHEMNGNWYPWGNRASDYINAYRYIVDLARANNLRNIQWMWSINAENVPYSGIENVSNYYPGDSYVDLIGIDGFNFGNSTDFGGWKNFGDIFSHPYLYVSQTYNKPIFISETACSEEGGNKAKWVNNMFNSLENDYSKVKAVVWFNLLKEADWRINSSNSSTNAFITSLNK